MGSLEAQSAERIFQYGVIGILCVVFALVIRHLYKEARQDRQDNAKEREQLKIELASEREACKTERETLRTEHERKMREYTERYVTQLDASRKEFISSIEKIEAQSQETNAAIFEMLSKLQDKIVSK